jgi:quinol monooxygenase YgiN
MKSNATAAPILIMLLIASGCQTTHKTSAPRSGGSPQQIENGMLVRISEIQIHPEHLEGYKAILQEEAEASMRLEPGVVSIFPMQQKDDQTEVRILEIYGNREAYEAHLKSPHFQKYKSTTLQMVKSLKLMDMKAIDPGTMTEIFKKSKTK